MKIGILTFHRAHNYGAVLQAYALKTFLRSLGHNVKLIDYWPLSHEKIYKLWDNDVLKNKSFIIRLKIVIKFLLLFFKKKKRVDKFNNFISSYLKLNKEIKYYKLSLAADLDVDCIIYGSDQIWRNWITSERYIGFDPTYFGYNVDSSIPKITYAASMGIIKYTKEEEVFLQKAITNFSTILVREKKLFNLLNSFDYKSNIVCDPVFLLSKKQWNDILPQSKYLTKEYVVYYRLLPSVEAEKLAYEVAKRYDCELLIITASVSLFYRKNERQTLSPLEFIQVIRDAKFVIATSFHGTAFSLIFEKQFYTLGLGANSDRVLTLFDNLGLKERYIEDFSKVNFHDIDYSDVKNKLSNMIYNSKKLLNEALDI